MANSDHSMQIIPDSRNIFNIASNKKSYTMNGWNTWSSWHMIPTSRPVVNPPAPKTNYIDIPGGNGSIDASEVLTGYPIYSNRTGSFEFYVLNGHSVLSKNKMDQTWEKYNEFAVRYSNAMDYIHGQMVKVILKDDPSYYYRGRLSVNNWKSDKTYAKITIDYNFEPYKYELFDSTEDWLWDPFSFVDGIIRSRNISSESMFDPDNQYTFTVGSVFGEIHTLDIPIRTYSATPEFVVKASSSGSQLKIYKYNSSGRAIQKTAVVNATDTSEHTYRFYNIKLIPNLSQSTVKLGFEASSGDTFTVTVKYRGGRL